MNMCDNRMNKSDESTLYLLTIVYCYFPVNFFIYMYVNG